MLFLKVVSLNVPTIFEMQMDLNGTFHATGGADYTLLRILAENVPFRYQVLNRADYDYGAINDIGEWTGMISMLMKNEADIAMGWMSHTYVRHQVVDFSFPYLLDSSVFVTAAPGVQIGEFPYLDPFQVMVWYLLLISLPISAAIVHMLSLGRRQKCEFTRGWFQESAKLLALLLNQGSYSSYRRVRVKLFMFVWSMSKLVLVFSYSSTLLAVLMVPHMESPLKDVGELRDAVVSGRYQFGTFKGTSYLGTLMNADSGVLKDLGDHIRSHPENVLQGFETSVSRAESGRFATLGMHLHMMLKSSRVGLHRFYISRDSFGHNPVSVACRKGFPHMERFNRIIHRIRESGLYTKRIEDMTYQSKLKAPPGTPNDGRRSLSYADIRTAVQLLYSGYIISACCLLFEIGFYRYHPHTVKWDIFSPMQYLKKD